MTNDNETGMITVTRLLYGPPIFYAPRFDPIGGALIATIQLDKIYPFFSVAFQGEQTPHSLATQLDKFNQLVSSQVFVGYDRKQWLEILITANFLMDKWNRSGHYANAIGIAGAMAQPLTKGQETVYDRVIKHVNQGLRQQAVAHLS